MSSTSTPQKEPIIVARDLYKTYGDLVAVDHIDFKIYPGECFGFLGPNGAGKTTTMKMIYGFSPITSGHLTVFGLPVQSHSRQIRARLGICPQEDNLDPDFTVLENLLVYARYFGIPKSVALDRALQLLDFFDLLHKKDQIIRTLSGGMKRRLLLARAMINHPEVLILDEPTTGLDPQARHAIWDRILSLKEQGVTILLTTHYMEEAERLCDRLVIMDHGRILVEGRPQQLIHDLVGHEVIEIYPANGFVDRIRERFPDLEVETYHNRLEIFLRESDTEVTEYILEHLQPPSLYVRRATLEDVFFKMTGRQLRD